MARRNNLRKLIESANKDIPVQQSFLQELKKSIEMTDQKNKRKGSNCYKPSSMKCIRQSYYMVSGHEPDEESSGYCLVGICQSGSDIHEHIQQAVIDMKENGFDCEYVNVAEYVRSHNLEHLEIKKEPDFENGEYETKLYNKELNISFLCDGIIRYKHKYYILELKTETSYKFMSRKDVAEEHHNQAITYSLNLGINDVLFVYISRDNNDMKSYLYTPTQDEKDYIVDYITTCDGYVDRGICPPKPEGLEKKICTYCSYKSLCKKDAN